MGAVRAERVVKREIGGRILLIPVAGNIADLEKIYALEGCGEFLWDLLDGRSNDELARCVAKEFDIGIEDAVRDVEDFVGRLRELGLVEEKDD